MAYDKVVDSSVLDDGLTQIADAIREKAGTSDALAFPTAMAEAIAAIQAGGGVATYCETVTFASKTNEYSIEHNLGAKPNFLLIVPMFTASSVGTFQSVFVSNMVISGKLYYSAAGTGNTGTDSKAYARVSHYMFEDKTYEHIEVDPFKGKSLICPMTVTENLLKLKGSSYYFPAGTYFVYCGVADFGGVA